MTVLLVTREPWMESGNCRGVDPALFFPTQGESLAAAKAVCRACEVRAECLNFALTHMEKFGVWGGYSEKERRRMRREQNIASVRVPRREHGTRNGYDQHRRHGDEPCPACKTAVAAYHADRARRNRAAGAA